MRFFSDQSSLFLECTKCAEEEESVEIFINDGSRKMVIDQTNQNVLIFEGDKEIDSASFPHMPVSLSTTYAVEDILQNDSCQLTPLHETYSINLDFLNSLLIFCNNLPDNNFIRCPIT